MTADKLTSYLVADMLGRPGRSETYTILNTALAGDCPAALAAFKTAYSRGGEPEMLVTDLLELVHLASMQSAGGNDDALLESERAMVANLAKAGIAQLGRAWQLLLKGHAELGLSPNPAASCEMLIIRLAHAAQMPTPAELMKKISQTPDASPNTPPAPSAPEADMSATSIKDTQKQPDLHQPNPEMIQLTSLISIVNLAETNGEILLAARIRNHVRLVSLKPGNLQIALTGAAPDQLVGDIARYLSEWTGHRWLVSLSEFGGEKTLAEQQREADQKLRDVIANEPLVARILDIFPGASIDEIKTPETATTDTITGSDDTTLTATANDEEMSG